MKTLLVIMLLAGFGDALAQDTKNPRAYDAQGKYQGYGVKRPDGNLRVYDKVGNLTSIAVERPGGRCRVYESKTGRLIGVMQK